MSVREYLLRILEENRGDYLSGEEMASKLHVTRGAVWKAIRALQSEGYPIHGVPRRGYSLSPETDILSESGIRKYLSAEASGLRFLVKKKIDSTNSALKELALSGEAEGLVIVSEEQSAGRGRRGRSFFSPSGTGIYMSILLRPQCPASESILLTAAAAAAVSEVLEEVSAVPAQIKWVNDVRMHDKKVCGILSEAVMSVENGGLDFIIVGIGINVSAPREGFPPDISEIAGSVFPHGQRPRDVRNLITAHILNRYIPLCAHPGERRFLPEYRKRLFFLGREISILDPSAPRRAVALDIDNDCRLLVREKDGSVTSLSSGEISILP